MLHLCRPLRFLFLAIGCGIAIAGGGWAFADEPLTFYTGNFLEDPAANPEDTTDGFACLPEKNSTFTAQFLSSFVGCMGGIDGGRIEGHKTGACLTDNWTGTMDGCAIGGGFGQSLVWLAFTYKASLRYNKGSLGPMELVPHRPLEQGKRYIVVVQAVRSASLMGMVRADAVIVARQTVKP